MTNTEELQELQKLPKVVNIKGIGIPDITAECIERTNKKALYERSDEIWEVFKVQISPAAEIFGRQYPRREVYPGNEDFGKTAWCFNDENFARRKYNKI